LAQVRSHFGSSSRHNPRSPPARPRISAMESANGLEETVQVSDGKGIVTWRWVPEGAISGVVFIVHGMAEHIWRKTAPGTGYVTLATALRARGWAVIAYDQRGHGRTDPKSLGLIPCVQPFERLISDAQELWATFMKRISLPAASPRVLLGHSMGSIISQHVTSQLSPLPDGVVLSGPPEANPPPAIMKIAAKALSMYPQTSPVPLDLFGKFNAQFAPCRTESDWLSTNHANNEAYVADDQCGFRVNVGMFRGMMDHLAAIRAPGPVYDGLPRGLQTLILLGQADSCAGGGAKGVVPNVLGQLFRGYASVSGGTQPEVRLWVNARHEILNEDAAVVAGLTADLIAWIERLKPSGTPSKL